MKRSALETALKWLERADRSTQELETYLSKKGFSDDESLQAIKEVQRYGYLNDQNLADRVTKNLRQNLNGELKIQQKLAQRGLEPIDSVENATDRAVTLLNKKFHKEKDTSDPKIFAKAARSLASQGYQSEEIESAINLFFPNCEI